MTTYWLEFTLFVEGAPDPLPPLQVVDAGTVMDPAIRDAVLAHLAPRWPGAPLQVRIAHQTMRGRVVAGRGPGPLRPVATFRISEQHQLDLRQALADAEVLR